MRLTIGKKLNGLIIALELLSISGVVILATQLFTSDLSGLLRKGTLDVSSMLASRVRAEMKHVADRGRTLAAASLEDFRYPEDRLKFIQDNLAVDAQYVGMSVYRMADKEIAPGASVAAFTPLWRVVHPSVEKRVGLTGADFDEMDKKFPLQLAAVARGEVDFTIGVLKDGSPVLRMGLPFVQKSDGTFSQLLVIELQQEKLTSLFSESTSYGSFLLDRRGRVLGSTDPSMFPLGSPMEGNGLFLEMRRTKADSGQMDYVDATGEEQMGAYRRVGFADLAVFTQVPTARATVAQKQLIRRTSFLGGAFLGLAFALGFWFSQSITGPIRALADAARRVKDGDFKVRLNTRAAPAKDGSEIPAGDEIQQFSGTFNEMVAGLEERDKVKATFAKFHSKEMAEAVLSGELKLGGERKNAAVFFSDVRGFTAMSEKMDPEMLVKILNRYMSKMVHEILANGGIVDKYVGDAIMAVWGVPLEKEGDVERALRACLGMRKALDEFNTELISEGLPVLKIGMGLNYGPLISGNIGSDERMEYTVIGDTVNTASRIESLTKEFGTDLLVSQAVLDQCKGKFVVEKTHEAMVKGKSEPLVVYKVHGYVDENGKPVLVETPYSVYAAEKSDKVVHAPDKSAHAPAVAAVVTPPPAPVPAEVTAPIEVLAAAEQFPEPPAYFAEDENPDENYAVDAAPPSGEALPEPQPFTAEDENPAYDYVAAGGEKTDPMIEPPAAAKAPEPPRLPARDVSMVAIARPPAPQAGTPPKAVAAPAPVASQPAPLPIDISELPKLWLNQAELEATRSLFELMREDSDFGDFTGRMLELAADLYQMNQALLLELSDDGRIFVRNHYGFREDAALSEAVCEAAPAEIQEFLEDQGSAPLLLEAPVVTELEDNAPSDEEEIETGELLLAHKIAQTFFGSHPDREEILLVPLVIRGKLYGLIAFYDSPDQHAGSTTTFESAERLGNAVATVLEYRFMLAWAVRAAAMGAPDAGAQGSSDAAAA